MSKPKVSIIVLNWNGYKDTVECLKSLKDIAYPNFEVIVVDNASSGKDVEIFKTYINETTKLIVNEENFGFSKGNNVGVREALKDKEVKYIVFLNNDTVVDKKFLDFLVDAAEKNSEIAIAGPKMYYYDYDGKSNVVWFGGGKINWFSPPGHYHIDQYIEDDNNAPTGKIKAVDWISGACLMLNIRKIDPYLNEEYFFGCEDIDKCLKAKKQRLLVAYIEDAKIWHKVGKSRVRGWRQNLKADLTDFKLIKNNNCLWIFIIPYFSLVIIFRIFFKNIKKLLKKFIV